VEECADVLGFEVGDQGLQEGAGVVGGAVGGGVEEGGIAAVFADGGAEDELVVYERGEGGDGGVAVAF
jgi:hypothetical protein